MQKLLGVIAIVAILVFLGGTLYENHLLMKDIEEVKGELENETQLRLSYEEKLEQTIADKLKAEDDFKELKQVAEKLSTDNNDLRESKKSLDKVNAALKVELSKLKAENDKLKK